MNQEREESTSIPIACTLTPTELAALRNGLLPGLLVRASAQEPIPGGFRWRFDPQADLVKEAAMVIMLNTVAAGSCTSSCSSNLATGRYGSKSPGRREPQPFCPRCSTRRPRGPAGGDDAPPHRWFLPTCCLLRDRGMFCVLGLASLGAYALVDPCWRREFDPVRHLSNSSRLNLCGPSIRGIRRCVYRRFTPVAVDRRRSSTRSLGRSRSLPLPSWGFRHSLGSEGVNAPGVTSGPTWLERSRK